MTRAYGLPYKGSKNGIVKFIIDNIPSGKDKILVDLFGGGGAVTHYAMEQDKYSGYILNDIQPGLTDFFMECVNGEHTIEKHSKWISREEFFKYKDSDWYIKLCWSFGNNGCDYMYSREIEYWKKMLWMSRVFGDFSLFENIGINTDGSSKDINENKEEYKNKYLIHTLQSLESLQNLQSLERVRSLESLQRLQRLQNLQTQKNKLVTLCQSYETVIIPDNAVIYCDIPYNNTECGCYDGFDYDKFYDWAEKQKDIYISEYTMPEDRFIPIAEIEKPVLSSGQGILQKKAIEKIWVPRNNL